MTITAATPQAAHEHIGPYEVLRYLTAGGMADLFLARSERRREPVVIKRVQARYLDNPRVTAMFLDEGQIGGLLNHPNIVHTFEVGQAEGYPYIAMEYIAGHDLVEILRSCTARKLACPRDLGIALCAHVARGLAYAHELRDDKGRPLEIVHCDISPGNVMLSWRGAIKLVDFGVSRARIPLHCQERGVAGKYNYMAPEQILGAPIDRRTDLFSLGVILYELTLGQRLFRGRPEVVMRQVVEEPIPPPRQLCPDYPEELQGIVMRLLQRDPGQRYPTAEGLRVDLTAYLAKSPRPHGKRELARFLRALFDHPAGEDLDEPNEPNEPNEIAGPDGDDDPRETLDLSGPVQKPVPFPTLPVPQDTGRGLTHDIRPEGPTSSQQALLVRAARRRRRLWRRNKQKILFAAALLALLLFVVYSIAQR